MAAVDLAVAVADAVVLWLDEPEGSRDNRDYFAEMEALASQYKAARTDRDAGSEPSA
ncbi:hypothetical protein GCM10010168_85940 [Actinoplanes ianthinogenes]|uniref:Uncharacterized protein n=1 Tax=Actinoplanes ianthinogenes TaxID=122358 RepID=A0ABM7M134_9ACTN|nr:hypothetical protein [Actinoplanes ianthinogenes]BCJ45325.1 hypothetical protein Aiant_59820 [Actinoplanes ianthinogenes]GGR53785.1 hypothetical protein GCM10010168_85940 [Actinoplanes ianthinogenes]